MLSKPLIIAIVFCMFMDMAAVWQFVRYMHKSDLARHMELELSKEPAQLSEILKLPADHHGYRKVHLAGEFDFEHEVIITNRTLGRERGGYVLTPLRTEDGTVLVNRGFLPTGVLGQLERFRGQIRFDGVGLTRLSQERRFFLAPPDKIGKTVEEGLNWQRANIAAISAELGMKLLPFYVEATVPKIFEDLFLKTSGRGEIFEMPIAAPGEVAVKAPTVFTGTEPIPITEGISPAGMHLGYVFEWLFMSFVTFFIGLIVHLRARAKITLTNSITSSDP